MSFIMDYNIHIDPQRDGAQPGPHKSNEDVPFDAAGFNAAVLGAIEQYKSLSADDPPPFDTNDELTPDEHILLYLVIRTFIPESQVDEGTCDRHLKLRQNRLLPGALRTAYTSHNFASLLFHDAMPDDVKERAPKQGHHSEHKWRPTRPATLTSSQLSVAFQGSLHWRYRQAANRDFEPRAWSLSVVQASGMGKSRMVEEAGKTVFTFPINIRQETETGKKAYPPPDNKIRQFFEERVNSNDKTQQTDYMLLLREMFIRALAMVDAYFPGLTGAKLALAWANYLAEGETDMEPGHHRRQFYDKVVGKVNEKISNRTKIDLDILERSLQMNCDRLAKRMQPVSDNTNVCFVYIDEAHSLTQAVKDKNKEHKYSQLHNLSKALVTLIDYPMCFIFLSTSSSLRGYAPAPSYYRSERVILGSALIPPFTELPIDIYEDKVIEEFGSMTLIKACEVGVMVRFGRPLWYTIHNVDPNTDVFDYAKNKLSADGKPGHETDSILAALGVRMGIVFDGKEITFDEEGVTVDEKHPNWIQSRLVESHMRMAYSIPHRQGYMHTGSPSEPVLAEAAGRYLDEGNRRGMMIEGLKRLCEALGDGTSAHDIALRDVNRGPLRPISNRPSYHHPIRVVDFLCALFHKNHHIKIRDAKSLTRRDGIASLGKAFYNSFVFFSHFALAGDSEMLSAPALATALLRGMAIQAKAGQESIDAVIPIHMGSLDNPVSAETTSAINLQIKNRQGLSRCQIDRSITVPNAKMSVISIILELGATGKQSNTIEVLEGPDKQLCNKDKLGSDDHHNQIVARGCSSEMFGPVTSETEGHYRAMLGAGSVLEDFARCDRKNNVEALRAMKPVMDGEQQIGRYHTMESEEGSTGLGSS
ncbi:G2/mitotic-specific cyclin cdc13, putative, partial [Rhizoctonia solani AG-3 Rhs1AP]